MEQEKPGAERIKQYYDGHAQEVQESTGVNRRHRSIFRRLRATGLGRDHHVLEVGCGVGQLTGLLSKYLTKGDILSVDISAKAVQLAQQHHAGRRNVEFRVSDMSDFNEPRRFDRVVLPDVLEHIPFEQHASLFATLAAHLAPGGRICIHVPDPGSTRWARRERPDLLQIIDHEIDMLPLAQHCAPHGLVVLRYEPYGLWTVEPDYDWIEIGRPEVAPKRTRRPFVHQLLAEVLSRLR